MFSPTFNIAPVYTQQKNEIYCQLYMVQKGSGTNVNQLEIVHPPTASWFGVTNVNDWPLYDGLSSAATVIARAQGLHIQAGISHDSWQNYFSIVFEDDRFKGSSLQVMGPVVEQGEWAIVGGTGQFHLAQGVILKKNVENQKEKTIEFKIHAFYFAGQPWTLGV